MDPNSTQKRDYAEQTRLLLSGFPGSILFVPDYFVLGNKGIEILLAGILRYTRD